MSVTTDDPTVVVEASAPAVEVKVKKRKKVKVRRSKKWQRAMKKRWRKTKNAIKSVATSGASKAKKGAKKVSKAVKRAATTTAGAVVRAGRWVYQKAFVAGRAIRTGAVVAASAIWTGIRMTGYYLTRGLSWVGLGATRAVYSVYAFLVGVLASISFGTIGLITLVVAGLVLALGFTGDGWYKYVVTTFSYFVRRPKMSLKKYRKARVAAHNGKREEDKKIKVAKSTLPKGPLKEVILDEQDAYGVPEGYTLVVRGSKWREDPESSEENIPFLVPDYEAPAPAPLLHRVKLDLLEDAETHSMKMPDHQIGGDFSEETWNHPATAFFEDHDFAEFLSRPENHDRATADFTEWATSPHFAEYVDQMCEVDRDHMTFQEHAYWTGRQEVLGMISRFGETVWTDPGRTWGYVFQRYQHRKATYPMAFLRSGVKAMTTELAKAHSTAGV